MARFTSVNAASWRLQALAVQTEPCALELRTLVEYAPMRNDNAVNA